MNLQYLWNPPDRVMKRLKQFKQSKAIGIDVIKKSRVSPCGQSFIVKEQAPHQTSEGFEGACNNTITMLALALIAELNGYEASDTWLSV